MRIFVILDGELQPIVALHGNASEYEVETWCEARGWKHVIVPFKVLKEDEAEGYSAPSLSECFKGDSVG